MAEENEEFHSLLLRGTRLLRRGKAVEAATVLQKAYAVDSSNLDAALNLGGALIMAGQFKKAVPILEELRDREPQNAMVWTNLGAAYLGNPVLAREEQQDDAIEAFKQALRLDPDAPSVAYNLGLIYRDRQEYEEAKRWFRRALDTNPADKHARMLLKRLKKDAN